MEENPFLHENDFTLRVIHLEIRPRQRYGAKIIGNHLQEPEELPSPINIAGSSNIAAVISKDGKFIYFASNRLVDMVDMTSYRSKIGKGRLI